MFLLLFLLLTSPLLAQAEIFHWIDEKGNKNFSDKPHRGAKIFQINASYSYYSVKKIYDGDTILLSNGSKVRFLGINTPEIEGRNKSAQAGGEEAKKWLQKTLKNKKLRLEKDQEKQDKYGRLLAHIFTEDKQHINLELVKKGLASVNIYPPNLMYTDDLLEGQDQAEKSQLGIWNRIEYTPKRVNDLNRSNYKGWQRILGKVEDIHHTRKNSYLKLSKSFSLKINKKNLNLFPNLNDYKNKKIEVRGWVNLQKKQYTMFIRHPSQIKINL